jgi:transcriptional regulator with XRE-family HTH domain
MTVGACQGTGKAQGSGKCFHLPMARPEAFDESVFLLGDWLARWRRAVGVSQRILADRAGIDQGGLSRVERGLQLVGGRRLARIIDTLDQLGEQRFLGPIGPPPFRRKEEAWSWPDLASDLDLEPGAGVDPAR